MIPQQERSIMFTRCTPLAIIMLVGCAPTDSGKGKASKDGTQTLAEARQGFTTTNLRATAPAGPLPAPPARLFVKTTFDAPVGKLSTYLTPDPKDGKKHPAIIWITGGDCNSVDGSIWQD